MTIRVLTMSMVVTVLTMPIVATVEILGKVPSDDIERLPTYTPINTTDIQVCNYYINYIQTRRKQTGLNFHLHTFFADEALAMPHTGKHIIAEDGAVEYSSFTCKRTGMNTHAVKDYSCI